nr:hypothetical protein [Tanacetum cinerariifolium]
MIVQTPKDMGEGSEIPTDPHHTPIVTQPSSSPPQKKQKSRRKQREEIEVLSPSSEIPNEEGIPTTSSDPLPSAKTAQEKEIASLKKRVKKLEQKTKSRTSELKRLRKVRSARRIESSTEASLGDQENASKQSRKIDDIDQDVGITLVDKTQERLNEEDMFGVNDLDGDEVVIDVEKSVKVIEMEVGTADPVITAGEVVTTAGIEVTTSATTPQISKDELTLAQTLIEIKAAKHKEPSETPSPKPIDSSQKPSQAKDKGKGKMAKPKRLLKRKDQIMMDAEVAKNLEAQMQAELKEKERLSRLKEEETNIALIES